SILAAAGACGAQRAERQNKCIFLSASLCSALSGSPATLVILSLPKDACGCPWLFVAGVRASLRQSGIEIFAVPDPGFPNIGSTLGYSYAVPTALAPWLRSFVARSRLPVSHARRRQSRDVDPAALGRVFERR